MAEFESRLKPALYDESESKKLKRTPRVYAISMNTSFVTSYPSVISFGASENVMLFTLLKKRESDVNKKNLFALFQSSIQNIKTKMLETEMIENDYCAAGLQEQNNTQEVYTAVNDEKFTFICKNVYETYGGTCAALGYIIKDFEPKNFLKIDKNYLWVNSNRPENFLEIDENYLWVNSNRPGKLLLETNDAEIKTPDQIIDEKYPNIKDRCYTIATNDRNAQYMAIRDLGTIEPVKIDEDNSIYLLKPPPPNKPDQPPTSPDCGRPIGIVIKKNKDNSIHTIHINCHMVNPSVLKPYTLMTNGLYSTPLDVDKKKTILQLGKEYYPGHWITYCISRLENTINDMLLKDFGLNKDDITESTFVLTGDLNDPDGHLSTYLNDYGINVLDTLVKFYYDKSNPLRTACPNTNSSFVGKDDQDDSREKEPFNKKFDELNTAYNDKDSDDGVILWNHFLYPANAADDISNPANFAFKGDIATIGSVGDINSLISKKEIFSNILPIEQTTDHLAVEMKVIHKSLGGKSRKSKTSKKGKSSKKSRKSRKSRKSKKSRK